MLSDSTQTDLELFCHIPVPGLDSYCDYVYIPSLEDRLHAVSGQWPSKCSVSLAGIPTLIVLDPQGEVITRQGRVEVLNDEDCREFPWHPKPVLELSDSNAVQLNEGPCLVLFVGMELRGSGGQVRMDLSWEVAIPAASFCH